MGLGKLVGANGLTFHATGVWQFGVNLGAKIGTIANPSGLVSAHDATGFVVATAGLVSRQNIR